MSLWSLLLVIIAGYLIIGVGKLVGTLIHLYVLWMKDEDHKVYADTVKQHEGFGVLRSHAHVTPYRAIVAGMDGIFFEYHVKTKKMSNEHALELARCMSDWMLFDFYVIVSILFWPKVGMKIRPHKD